jgi:uncharacterized protein YqgV (UPF0045/DUF77 family)
VRVVAEFLVEPFREGALGPHVSSAIDAVESAGLSVDVGPFGSEVSGEADVVVAALAAAMRAALGAGASRFTLNLSVAQ